MTYSTYEARDENMVSLKGEKPKVRLARFLKPLARTVEQAVRIPDTPLLHEIFSHSKKGWPSKVVFKGWKPPQKKWEQWVDSLAGKYCGIWKQAGICDAIISSIYSFPCNRNVVLALSEFWCPETNTFVFPWAEVTITLEDAFILGGLPVVGEPVTMPLAGDLEKVKEEMEKQRREFNKTTGRKAGYGVWLEHFMDKESELEHVAFLSLWLSRFVLPSHPEDAVGSNVFSIAVHLSRGTKIALAPAVLASLYHNLRLLKEQAVASSGSISVSGPFQLVQLWAFERFPMLVTSSPRLTTPGEPRAARWHNATSKLNIPHVKSVLNLRENFCWRPYAADLKNVNHQGLYKETGQVVFSCSASSADEEVQSFFQCLKACELVGIDCREMYLPQRASMQFGMDQDLPGDISGLDFNQDGTCFYIAPTSYYAGISERYSDWWTKSLSARQDAVKDILCQGRSLSNLKSNVYIARPASEVSNGSVSFNIHPEQKEANKNAIPDHVSETPRTKEKLENPSHSLKSDAKKSTFSIHPESPSEKVQQEAQIDDYLDSLPISESIKLYRSAAKSTKNFWSFSTHIT